MVTPDAAVMPTFRIRAQWWGPDGAQCGVADEVEAEDACAALEAAKPLEYMAGEFTHAMITIEPLPSAAERRVMPTSPAKPPPR